MHDKPFVPPFIIEFRECGVWNFYAAYDTFQEVLFNASALVESYTGFREENIRIIDGNNRII